ncbi:MAG TPA: heparan-alpha-glucosaminide N-acetyltransferase domain-containing protein [bacterium]|nr:heparan-alpha-glucosaminide N-acetyltransferase domain-containing protein [bacterium]HPR89605.1 heparan-alpha-glucosaminide N-acetyltransferase domain-containing protein [bacterium]
MKQTAAPIHPANPRIDSIDVLRGLTIALMIFVIAVGAGNYSDLPQQASWFGSLPVSTWNHADMGWEHFANAKSAAGLSPEEIAALPEARLKNIGLTATDLVAPFFVFVVGLVIPLSKGRRGGAWWHHVLRRTGLLILAGVLYISLILGLSWWWGILQAIGVAYLMGAITLKLRPALRWVALFAVLGLHLLLSQYAGWWLQFGHTAAPFWTIGTPTGDWARPLTVHCLPWVSMSYGAITMAGVLLGEAIATGEQRRIIRRSLLLALVFGGLGLALHQLGFLSGNLKLCFNKPDVSASYALFTSGLASLLFLVLYVVVDLRGYKKWAWPFIEFGRNALLAYFLQIIMRLGFRALQIEPFFAGAPNGTTRTWAGLLGAPLQGLLLDKSGYHGMFWGLLWTLCLWLIVRWCNKHHFYWKF